ncbi:hypothetical protein RSOL_211170, partial [Rhizoctonia solani AG-3 Rhs1AP]
MRRLSSEGEEVQKYRSRVDILRRTMFNDAVTELLEKLDTMADNVGVILSVALGELADQTEVNLATLWHVSNISPEEAQKRAEVVREADNMLIQTRRWLDKISAEKSSSS